MQVSNTVCILARIEFSVESRILKIGWMVQKLQLITNREEGQEEVTSSPPPPPWSALANYNLCACNFARKKLCAHALTLPPNVHSWTEITRQRMDHLRAHFTFWSCGGRTIQKPTVTLWINSKVQESNECMKNRSMGHWKAMFKSYTSKRLMANFREFCEDNQEGSGTCSWSWSGRFAEAKGHKS